MKGRPRRDGDRTTRSSTSGSCESLDEGPSPKGRRPPSRLCAGVMYQASMKGRPRRDGDARPDGLGGVTICASMKGRPRRDGDLGTCFQLCFWVNASMKGRPRRDGDSTDRR